MQIFDFAEFTQDIPKVFSTALVDEVVINNTDGNSYKLLPIKENERAGKSPLEGIPRIKLNITTQEIVEILQECRAGL
jgi:hypothetical protein